MKAHFGPVRVNASLFYDDIHNLQVTADAGSCSSRVVFNVPKAHSEGVEFEIAATPIKRVDLSLSGTAVRSKFDSTLSDGAGGDVGGIRKGNRLPTVPNFQMSAGGTYTAPLPGDRQIYLSANYQYVGNRYTQPGDQEDNPRTFISNLPFGGATGLVPTILDLKLPAYSIVNLSTGVRFPGNLEISIYVNNVTNKLALLAFDRERGGRARLAFDVNQPRTFGVTLHKSF